MERLDKHRFRVRTGGAAAVTVRWRVYANELTVRTSHLDATHGFVSPAGVFLAVRGREAEPHQLVVAPPPGWQVATALAGGPTEFTARDYDELIDSPLELGTHRLVTVRGAGGAARAGGLGARQRRPDAALGGPRDHRRDGGRASGAGCPTSATSSSSTSPARGAAAWSTWPPRRCSTRGSASPIPRPTATRSRCSSTSSSTPGT